MAKIFEMPPAEERPKKDFAEGHQADVIAFPSKGEESEVKINEITLEKQDLINAERAPLADLVLLVASGQLEASDGWLKELRRSPEDKEILKVVRNMQHHIAELSEKLTDREAVRRTADPKKMIETEVDEKGKLHRAAKQDIAS